MSAGAGAGALASCVAQGASALFSPDQLPDLLHSLGARTDDDLLSAAPLNYSARFRALVELTASERRVLYYLTEGWTAQDMTDELVVSLTTVRSHIRSVLRKLGVRSQLAAVAIANGRDLRRDSSRGLP
jgi:DNA-binding NarL/FixJ family response regulator